MLCGKGSSMPRALPFRACQLFVLMKSLGYSQTRCAQELHLTQQTVNNWAAGWNVASRHRSALASLVTLAIHQSLEPETPLSPEVLAERTALVNRYTVQWVFENHDALGIHDEQ